MKTRKYRKMKKCLVILPAVSLFTFLIYSLLFGKLFPYSPIVIGFEKTELEHVIVYAEKGAAFTGFDEIDSYIPLVEKFHSLTFIKKPRIFLFGNEKTYAQRSLSKARFCAYYNGDIVVSPWAQQDAQDGLISMEIYLRHELSHSLLHQNAGFLNAARYPKWLLEGIAMYSANQMGTSCYPSKEEIYDYIHQGSFIYPRLFKTKQEAQVKLDVENRITFMYSEFGCIVDYMVSSYGKENFLQYMVRLLNGENHDLVFQQIFQTGFEEFIDHFKQHVMIVTKPVEPSTTTIIK